MNIPRERTRKARAVIIANCVAACALWLVVLGAGTAHAVVVTAANGHRYGIMLRPGASPPAGLSPVVPTRPSGRLTPNLVASAANVDYNGGPVLHSTDPYLIFWDPASSITGRSESLIERYLTDASTAGASDSDVYGVLRQYYDSTGYAGVHINSSASTQSFVDTQSYPTSGCAVPSGYMGPGDSSSTLFAIMPFSVFQFGPKGCQGDGSSVYQSPNSDPADQIIDNLSHELSETITDPTGASWYSQTYANEVGDNCSVAGSSVDPTLFEDPNSYLPTLGGDVNAGTLYDQLIAGDQYFTQTEWSNGSSNCLAQPTPATVSPTFTAPDWIAPGGSASLDPSGSTAVSGIASSTWDFGDGTSSFGIGSPTSVSHQYTSLGNRTVTLELVDSNGQVASTTRVIHVGIQPTAAFAASSPVVAARSASFNGGASTDSNAASSIDGYRWTFGDGSTATGSHVHHTYHHGKYRVTLQITDNYGFTASLTKTVSVMRVARITRIRTFATRRADYVKIRVTQPGRLRVGHSVKTRRRAGTAKLKLRLTANQRRRLSLGRRVRLRVTIVYVPRYDPKIRVTRRLTLRRL